MIGCCSCDYVFRSVHVLPGKIFSHAITIHATLPFTQHLYYFRCNNIIQRQCNLCTGRMFLACTNKWPRHWQTLLSDRIPINSRSWILRDNLIYHWYSHLIRNCLSLTMQTISICSRSHFCVEKVIYSCSISGKHAPSIM